MDRFPEDVKSEEGPVPSALSGKCGELVPSVVGACRPGGNMIEWSYRREPVVGPATPRFA